MPRPHFPRRYAMRARQLLALAIMSVISASAVAQAPQSSPPEDQSSADARTLDAVIVVGQRLSNQRALNAKRDSAVISDVLASDDLNKLPDQNIAEGLARLPGVTTFQDEGAGLYVGIRGLNQEFVNLTVDGMEVSSAARTWDESLKGANMESIPATAVQQVEVFKSVTPDLDGDAIAGTVNMVTRSALSADAPWFNVGGALGEYKVDVPPGGMGMSSKGNVSFGRTFAGGTLGLVVDANFRNVERDNLKPYAWWGAAADGGRALPEEVGGFIYERDETSKGFTAKLEFQPSDRFTGNVAVNYHDSETGVDKNKHALYSAQSDPSTGSFSGAAATVRNDKLVYGIDDALTVSGAAEWQLGRASALSLKASTSESASYHDDPRVDWYLGGPLSGSYAFNGEAFEYALDEAGQRAWDDIDSYVFNGYRRFQERLEKQVDTYRLDWETMPSLDLGLTFKAGLKHKGTEADYTASNFRWDRPQGTPDFKQFLDFHAHAAPGTNASSILLTDVEALAALAEGHGPEGFGRVRSVINNGSDYRISEDVAAGYAMAEYASDQWRIAGGWRYEHTSTEVFNRFNHEEDAPYVRTEGSYSNWLPSIAMTRLIGDAVQLRAGVSRTIGRPDLRDLARGETPPNENGYYGKGNPDLKPRISTNIDLGLEYYFDHGNSLVSAAVFSKEIDDEIYDLQTPYTFIDDLGQPLQAYFIQPMNGGGATIRGLELSLVKDSLGFLPGAWANLGFSANVTFNDGDFELLASDGSVLREVAPEGMSERLANVTLYYQGDRFSARAAWRHASEQVQSLSIDGSADLMLDSYQQTDLSFGYKLNERWELFGEVWNVFEDDQSFTDTNAVTGFPNWFEQVRYGRAVWVGMNYRF